jgi:hypothetical protein
MSLAAWVYLLCLATCAVCAGLLVRAWLRTKTRLLFWSAVSFVFLAMNNCLLFADMVLLPSVDLAPLRYITSLAAVIALIFGFIWEAER